jgi:CubicO group peptidase (beta-lactamase class C family)
MGRSRTCVCGFALVMWLAACLPGTALAQLSNLGEKHPDVRALVVARGECVVAEYYRAGLDAGSRSPVYSVSKSVLSILVGIAIDKGLMHLDEKLGEILSETLDEGIDPAMREIQVRDLLTMTAGFDGARTRSAEPSGYPAREAWRWMLNGRLRYPPGSHFEYGDRSPGLLSVALAKATHQSSDRFARDNLFAPLGIDNYVWYVDAEGNLVVDQGLFLTARDMAKIGLLYLRNGRWGDAAIVSSGYVAGSTAAHNDGGPPVGAAYGYFWWVERPQSQLASYFAAGHKSQLIYVVPDRGLVIALAADGIPGGSRAFLSEAVLPMERALPPETPCVARLDMQLPR